LEEKIAKAVVVIGVVAVDDVEDAQEADTPTDDRRAPRWTTLRGLWG